MALLEAANADADKSVESADSVAGSGSAGTDNATDSHTDVNTPMDTMAGGFHDQASGNKLADDVERGENSGTMQVGGVGGVPDSTAQKISKAGYLKRIERLESIYGSPNAHSLEKHGAQTTGMKQYRRVQHKDYPNPTTGAPGNKTKTASKFLTNKDHYEALRSAILQRKANPEINDFDIVMERNIGVNIRNLGSHKNRGPYSAEYTNTAMVRFDPNTGKMFTAFPIPEKK